VSNILNEDHLLPLFRELFPEFSETSDSKVLVYLKLSLKIFNKCEDATLYLSAHLLVLSNANDQTIGSNQSSLPLSSIKAGSKSANIVKYTNSNDSQYTVTNYGIIFIQLKRASSKYNFAIGISND
jgi:hypothetical protein